MSSVVHIVN